MTRNGEWSLKRVKQCSKCPWKVTANPFDIPNGYSVERHENLERTIADPSVINLGTLDVMACHESNNDEYCIGWLINQIGRGNNIALRLKMMSCANSREIQTVGKQHERFEDTIPN